MDRDQALGELLREFRELKERVVELNWLPSALTVTRAAAELSVSAKKLRRMIADGSIMTCEIGKTKMIPRIEIERLTTPQAPVPAPRRPRGAARRSSPKAEAAKLRQALKRQ